MPHLDRIVLAAIGGLAILIAALAFTSVRLGATVDSLNVAESLDGASVNTQVGVTFTQPMRFPTVRRAFSIAPAVKGDVSWAGNEMLFVPRGSLRFSTRYTVRIGTEAQDSSGRHLVRPYVAHFTTQSEHLLVLGTAGSDRGRLVLTSVTGDREVIGSDDGQVTDFSVSQDRTLAVYTHRSRPGARSDEVWLLSIQDGSSQRLFARPDWDMSSPHLSPDGRYVVFLAKNVRICAHYYRCYRDVSAPLVYLLDVRTHSVRRFSPGTDTPITDFVDFSPAGQIAYTDLGSALTLADPNGTHVVHIPDAGNSPLYQGFSPRGDQAAFVGQTPDSTGGDILVYNQRSYLDVSRGVYDSSVPSFSSSGADIAYSAYRGERGIEPIYGVNVYNFRTHQTRRITGLHEHAWTDWAPVWSPDDAYVAFMRSSPREAMYLGSGEVWAAHPDGSAARPLGVSGQHVQWVW